MAGTELHKDCCEAVKAKVVQSYTDGFIKGLSSVSDINIREEMLAEDGMPYRGVTIVPRAPILGIGTNQREDISFPVHIFISNGVTVNRTDSIAMQPNAFLDLMQRFTNVRLSLAFPGANEIICNASPGKLHQDIKGRRVKISTLVVHCWMRISRK